MRIFIILGTTVIRIFFLLTHVTVQESLRRNFDVKEETESNRYCMCQKSVNPPHIFAVADSAYQCITGYGGRTPMNQCVLISGESGAGKTESTKLIIKQLIELCRGQTQLEEQILQVNPLLEAFGNAQTQMNDNSSRFGKYIQLKFAEGHVKGAKISEYLLEKSRVVSQNQGEENFHIFYYMFAGLSKEEQQKFHMDRSSKYKYLTYGLGSDNKRLRTHHEDLVNAMDMVGFTDEEQHDLFTMVSCVLHLGNVSFGFDDNDAAYIEDENGPIKIAAKLLGINCEEVIATLTSMVTVTRGEYIKRNYTKEKAEDARDAMAKAIYGRLFGWIVNKVNQLLAPNENLPPEAYREIGILDIFGFEHFEKNSFEQSCINLANEQLQFFFNQHVFRLEQEEYAKEGIDWKEIKFIDNQPLLDLFLKPLGLLSLLDEETHFPKGTDLSFVEKLNVHLARNPHYEKTSRSNSVKFVINHYAGKVTYDGSGWLEKNRDTLPNGVMEILQSSKNGLVKMIFRGQVTRTGSLALQGNRSTRRTARKSREKAAGSNSANRKRKQTMGGQFKNSLQILMEKMMSASPIFVRCLKPNHYKAPGNFNAKYMGEQLLYTGMLETIKIRREGFAVRPSFPEFADKYKIILCKASLLGTRENCAKIIQASKIKGSQIGKTKIFLKYYHIEQLSNILEAMGKSAVHLQKVVRGFLARRLCHRKREAARLEALHVQQFLQHINDLNIDLDNKYQIAAMNDKKIRQSFFGKLDDSTPPVPYFPDQISPIPSVNDYLKPKKGKMVDSGCQADSSESEVSEDDFTAVPSHKFNQGTKGASMHWFRETQAMQIYDPDNVNFIAEWFHGVISRRESERLLRGSKPGCFLIRVSESRFGYSLSFQDKDRCHHYMIDQLPNKKFLILGEKKVHRTLKDLVQYHKTVKISNWDGFLTEPCGQEHGQCDYQDLVTESFYHVLERPGEKKKMVNRDSGIHGRSSAMHSRRSDPVRPLPKIPDSHDPHGAPHLPTVNEMEQPSMHNRNNTGAKGSPMSNRPLPKRPQEAYLRLLNNQEAQHRDQGHPRK
ncbi:hypothetical protein ScPMuIL_018631 [Solemya velum]